MNMLRTILIALLGLSAFTLRNGGVAARAAPAPKHRPMIADLRWGFEKGKTVYLRITTQTRQTMTVMNNDVDQSRKQTLFLSWTPVGKKGDTWRICQRIEGAVAETDVGGSKSNYDSTEKNKKPNNPLSKVFTALVGSKITLILDANKGEIIRIEGKEELLEKLRVAAPKASPQLTHQVCDAVFTAVVEQFSTVLVGKKVKQGEKWTRRRTLDLGPLGSGEQKYVCRYEGKDSKDWRLDRVTIDTVQRYEKPANPPEGNGVVPFKIKKADIKSVEAANGFALYNPRKRRIDTQSLRLGMEGVLEIEIGGQLTKVELWQAQEIRIETSEESFLKRGTDSVAKPKTLRRKPHPPDLRDVGWPLPKELYISPPSPEEWLIGAAFSPDGRHLATDGQDIRLWNQRTRQVVRRFGIRNQRHHYILTFSPDGRFLFSDEGATVRRGEGGEFCDICMWDVSSGKLVRKFQGHRNVIESLAVASDGKTLVSSSADYSIRAWDAATGREVSRSFSRPDGRGKICRKIVSHPDGKFLAAWVDGEPVRLWDIARGREAQQLHHEKEPRAPARFEAITFAPDGRTLAASVWGTEKPICFWDVKSGRLIGEIAALKASTSKSNFLSINSLAYSPDGKLLASASDDETLRLWEVATGAELERWRVRRGVSWTDFSPNGRTLAAHTGDGSLILLEWGYRYSQDSKSTSASQPADVASLWAALAGADARAAFRAARELIARPGLAVDFLGKRLKAVPTVSPSRLTQLIVDLDHSEFTVRESASEKLRMLAEAAEPALSQAIDNPSLEVRKRARLLLGQLAAPPSRERLRFLRSVLVLEYIGTTEARRVLKKLAEGMRGMRETEDALAACGRLKRRAKTAEAPLDRARE